MRIMRRFLHTWLTVIVAVCFGLNGYANDYKKETKIIPGVVFKSDKKVKDKTPSGMGILSLTEKGGYVPYPAISIEGNFSGDTIYNGKAEDIFFLRFDANGTFTYSYEYDEQNKTTRLSIQQIDGFLNGCPVKNVPVITYVEDKNLCLNSIQVAAPSFITPMTENEFVKPTKPVSGQRGDQRYADTFHTLIDFPNTSIKSITYSISIKADAGFARFAREHKDCIKFNFVPQHFTTSDGVHIKYNVNPEQEFYMGDIQNPKAYGKLRYHSHELERMTVQTADGKATITLEESKRKDSYSKAINKWTVKFNDGKVYSGTLNGTGNLAPLLSYEKPNCEAFLNMMVALSKIKASDIPLYDGLMTFTNGKTENYKEGVSDTQVEATLNKKPVVINLNTPGSLLSAISPADLSKTKSLTISGRMNEDDAKVLTELGTNISYLNLQNCNITSDGTGDYYQIPMNFMKDRPKLKTVVFPKNLKSIDYFAFQNCIALEEVILPKSLKNMANRLWAGEDGTPFRGCTSLKKLIFNGSVLKSKLDLPGNITQNLQKIRFPGTSDGSAIGYYHGISGTVRNAKVYIPALVECDFGGTFENCEVYFESPKAPESIHYLKLNNCTIHIPKGSTTSYYSKFGNQNYVESDYPQPSTASANQSSSVPQKIDLSFNLFKKLVNQSTAQTLQYLKANGCQVKDCRDGSYLAHVSNGDMIIYSKNYRGSKLGSGAVEFITDDTSTYQSWSRSLRNADYEPSNDGLWSGPTAHYPVYGIYDCLESHDQGSVYAWNCALYLKAFPM